MRSIKRLLIFDKIVVEMNSWIRIKIKINSSDRNKIKGRKSFLNFLFFFIYFSLIKFFIIWEVLLHINLDYLARWEKSLNGSFHIGMSTSLRLWWLFWGSWEHLPWINGMKINIWHQNFLNSRFPRSRNDFIKIFPEFFSVDMSMCINHSAMFGISFLFDGDDVILLVITLLNICKLSLNHER